MMESKYVVCKDGTRIHTFVAGEATLPPLLLMHGYPMNGYLWRNCIPRLAKSFRVYAVDLPGFGKSDKPLDVSYDLDYFTDFLVEYFSLLELKSAAVAGHDLGGMISLGLAARYPHMVDKFIVMNTLPYKEWSKNMHSFYAKVRSPFWASILLRKFVFTYGVLKQLVHNPKVITKEVTTLFHTPWIENSTSRKAFSAVLSASPEAITEPKENLVKITAPTLILWGEDDTEMPPGLAEQLADDIPNSSLTLVANSGHFLQEDQPEEVAEKMLRFLLD